MDATRDVMKRRRTPKSSGFSQHLLETYADQYGRSNDTQLKFSSYQPPRDQCLRSDEQFHIKNEDSLLFLSTPKSSLSINRIQPRTPSYADNITTQIFPTKKITNPAHDYGSNSLLSYGCCCCQCVRTTEVGIVENFGRFETLIQPGLHCIPWPLVDIAGRVSLRLQQLDITCETKTSDSVFCHVIVTLQFRIIPEKVYDAYYRLTDPTYQIQSYVYDVIRSAIPKMTLDEVFASKKSIALDVRKSLSGVLQDYGYEVIESLLTDIRPVDSVVQSMNEIEASKRIKAAMVYRAEAEKLKKVKEAEALCESLYLHGVGVSSQRQIIAKEMKKCIQSANADKMKDENIMTLLLMTQYMDTMTTIAENKDNELSFLCCGGDGQLNELKSQLHDLY